MAEESTSEVLPQGSATVSPENQRSVESNEISESLKATLKLMQAEALSQGKTKQELNLDLASKATLLLDGSLTLGDLNAAGFKALATEIHPLVRRDAGGDDLGKAISDILKASRTPQLLVGISVSNRPMPENATNVWDKYKGLEIRVFDEYPSATNYPDPVLAIDALEGKDGRKLGGLSRRGASDVRDSARIKATTEDLNRLVKWAIENKKGSVSFEQDSTTPAAPVAAAA